MRHRSVSLPDHFGVDLFDKHFEQKRKNVVLVNAPLPALAVGGSMLTFADISNTISRLGPLRSIVSKKGFTTPATVKDATESKSFLSTSMFARFPLAFDFGLNIIELRALDDARMCVLDVNGIRLVRPHFPFGVSDHLIAIEPKEFSCAVLAESEITDVSGIGENLNDRLVYPFAPGRAWDTFLVEFPC